MKDFSIRQMRREYAGLLRICVGTAVVMLMIGAILGALSHSRGLDTGRALTVTGVFVALTVVCLSLYLVFSDQKYLLKKTPYGRALAARGDAQSLIREIDRAAEERYDPCGGFAILSDWLILFEPRGWRFEPYRLCAYPVRRGEIQRIQTVPGERNGDGELLPIVLICGDKRFETEGYKQHLDALRQWMRETERPYL